MTNNGSTRPSGRHRHTHSARAGVDLSVGKDRDVSSPAKSLSMTPATTKLTPGSTSTSGSVVDRSRKSTTGRQCEQESSDGANEDDVNGATQGRGRSKARGRRSVSRRSRSPPRAAARGRSKALLVEEVGRKGRNADSPPLAAVQPSSASPIAIQRRASNTDSNSGCCSSSAGEDLDRAAMGGPDGSARRGRSPVERRQRMSTIKAGRQGAPHPAPVSSPPLRERHQSLEFANPRLQAQQYVDPGFDDVEDLDLEL